MIRLAAVERRAITRWQLNALAVGVVALAVCIVGGWFDPGQFFRTYLAVYQYLLGLGLGALVLVMVYHLTGGAWNMLVRRILETQVQTLALLALMFVPIACDIHFIYPWAQPEVVAASENLQYKQFYLHPHFFWGRAAAYWVLWLALGYLLTWWSRRYDRTGHSRFPFLSEQTSAVGLVIYGVTIHFAAIDWFMSVQPAFHSSIFGPLTATGQILSAYAFTLIVFAGLAPRPPLAQLVSRKVLNDLGNLLLTFLVLWAYMVFFQYMLSWIADLPVDVTWYVDRLRGGWGWLAFVLVWLHFAIPLFALLLRSVKQNPQATALVAGLLLVAHLAYDYWQILPAYPVPTLAGHWMAFVMPLALGGIWLALFLWLLARTPLVPRDELSEHTALSLRESDEEELRREEALDHAEAAVHD